MKNDLGNSRMGLLFFLLTLVVALFSWIGSIYGVGEVQSLFSAEGIRWILGHAVSNYIQCPALGWILILFMGGGIVVKSGLYDILKRCCRKEKQLSRKERRALGAASVALLVLYQNNFRLRSLFSNIKNLLFQNHLQRYKLVHYIFL